MMSRISSQKTIDGVSKQRHIRFYLIGALCLLATLCNGAWANFGAMNGRSLVFPGQGITATSRITEVFRIDISETNTDDPTTAENEDDGGLELRRVFVEFADLRGIDPNNPGDELAFVSLWRINQEVDNNDFSMDDDFRFELNTLLVRARIDSTRIELLCPCDELARRTETPCEVFIPSVDMASRTELYQGGSAFVLNSKAVFFIAIETADRIDNNDQFSVAIEIESEDIVHQTILGNAYGDRGYLSRILTVVDSAGDLMPFPDVVTGGENDFRYAFQPHNYRDLFGQHPDALNILEDMEVPEVLPSESSRTEVMGIELAGIRSYLKYLNLNFISCQEGQNNDVYYTGDGRFVAGGDYWADDPAGRPGVFDPFIDEIFINRVDLLAGSPYNRDTHLVTYDLGDLCIYEGATPGIQTTQLGVDDDGDGRIDEELPNGLDGNVYADDDGDGLTDEDISLPLLQPLVDEDNQDYWAWYDENNNGVYDPATDELYFDTNGNGVLDIMAGIPQVSAAPERVYAGADGRWSLRAGDSYDNPSGQVVFFRLDDDGDGESGSPLSPNIFRDVPILASPAAPDNPFLRYPYYHTWPDADGIHDINNPTVFTGVPMADGLDNDGDSDDHDLNLDPALGGYEFCDAADSGAQAHPTLPGQFFRVIADGVDNDGDGEAESPLDQFGRAIADGIDNDNDGLIDEGIDENVDEGINEDPGDNAFNAITARQNSFGTYDHFLGDIDTVLLYQDNGDGQFDPATDTAISRHDPEQIDWYWTDLAPPYMSMRIDVNSELNDGKGARVPVTDDGTYDFFVVITMDGDDRGDYYEPGARFPNPANIKTGIILEDYEGVRPGDDFMVSLARGSKPEYGAGIGTDAGYPNASKVIKPVENKLYINDIISYVPDTVQGDESLGWQVDRPERVPLATDNDVFVGNPYVDALSSPIGVVGINVADNPYSLDGEQDYLDSVTVRLQVLTHDLMNRGIEFEGTFDIVNNSQIVSLPDLMPLADDSTGGVGLYRDNPDAGIQGGFDSMDIPVPLRNDFLQYSLVPGTTDTVQVTLKPTNGLELPGDDSSADNVGYDYYVAIRTSEGIDYRDAFRVHVADGAVRFRSGPSVQNSGVSTRSLVANVPVFGENLTYGNPETLIADFSRETSGTAVLGFNLYDRSGADSGLPTNWDYLLVNFANVSEDNPFTIEDLAPIGTGEFNTIAEGDGVALYRDTPWWVDPEAKPGFFDKTDQLVRAVPLIGNVDGFPNSVYLFLDPFGDDPLGNYQTTWPDQEENYQPDWVMGERVPPHDEDIYQGNDYFLVIRPDNDISNGDDFIVQARPLVNNNVVEWPMHFMPDAATPEVHTLSREALRSGEIVPAADDPGYLSQRDLRIYQEVNDVFRLNYSYHSVETNRIVANTQTDTVFTDLTRVNDTIEAESQPQALVGININDGGEPARTISQIQFDLLSPIVAGVNKPSATSADFNPFSPTPNSGFALYRDHATLGTHGEFDEYDEFVSLVPSGSAVQELVEGDQGVLRVSMTFSPGVEVPDDDLGSNAGADFFVVVRTSKHLSFRDQFRVRIVAGGITFESGPSFGNTTVTTNIITANVPVFPVDTTGFFGAALDRNDGPEDVIGLNFLTGTLLAPNTSNEKLVSLVVELNKGDGSTFTNSDLAPLTGNANSGIALYRDDGDQVGRFDSADSFIPVSNQLFYTGENEVYLRLATPEPLPPRDDYGTTAFGPDLFIVIRTSGSITQGSVFRVKVKDLRYETSLSDLLFSTGNINGGKVNEPPYLELVNPVIGDATNTLFTLRWEDFDPDSNALIDLFYVANDSYLGNGQSFDGLIRYPVIASDNQTEARDLAEDPDGLADNFEWDVSLVNPSLFSPDEPRLAELRVGGEIRDGLTSFVSASPSFITVTNATPDLRFSTYSGLNVIAGAVPQVLEGLDFNLAFSASDAEARGNVDIYMAEESVFNQLISASAEVFQATRRISDVVKGWDPENIFLINSQILSVTTSTTRAVTITGGKNGLSDQMIAGTSKTYYAFAHIWDIVGGQLKSDGSAGPLPITIIPNLPPSFEFVGELATGTGLLVNGDQEYTIAWTDGDPNPQSDARITLYYRLDGTAEETVVRGYSPGASGTTTNAQQIPHTDPNDAFIWDLSQLTAGVYHLRGVIEDELSQVEDRATLLFNRPSTFSYIAPTQSQLNLFVGEPLTIRWSDSNPTLDDDEQLQFFLENLSDSSRITLNSEWISVSDNKDVLEISSSNIPEGTYNLFVVIAPEADYEVDLTRTIYALDQSNQEVRIVFSQNDSPVFVFEPLSQAAAVTANPGISGVTRGGVIANGSALIPVVWSDYDDEPHNATIQLYYATDVTNASTYRALQGIYPPSTALGNNLLNLNDDNGPGPYAGRGAFVVDATQDVYFWNISDAQTVPRGEYAIVARVNDGLNPIVVRNTPNKISINRAPTIQFVNEPARTITWGDEITLSWQDSDPDSNALISLQYQIDQNLDGIPDTSPVLLASGIAEDPDGDNYDRLKVDTTQIRPAPTTSNYGLYFTLTIKDEVNSATDVWPTPSTSGVVIQPNTPPRLDLIRPNLADQQDASGFIRVYPDTLVRNGVDPALVRIAWANGSDDNAATTVALYYDTDRFGGDGVAIQQIDPLNRDSTSLSLVTNGEFLWDVSQVPPGDYYIYAMANDGANTPMPVYSPAFIRVNQPPQFTFLDPDGFNDEVFPGEPYTVVWEAYDSDSPALVNLFVDNDRDLTNGFGTNVADLNNGDLGLNIPVLNGIDRLAVETRQLPSGTYTLVARVDDFVNMPQIIQSTADLVIKHRPDGAPRIQITQPAGGSPSDPLVIDTPTFTVTWEDSPIPDTRVGQSFIQLYWDTDYYGNDGTIISGTDVAADGSVIHASVIPVELRPSDPNFPVELRDQDHFEVDISQFPAGQVLYLYARITDTGDINDGTYSSEYYRSNAFIINTAPQFRWIEPNEQNPIVNPRGNPLTVVFEARDPDTTALINLYLDDDQDSDNGLISVVDPGQNILESDGFQSIDLNLASEVAEASVPQIYRLLARITDGVTVTEVYSATFTVVENQPPTVELVQPDQALVLPQKGETLIEWIDDDPDSDALVTLFLDYDRQGESGLIIPGTYTTVYGEQLPCYNIPHKIDNGVLIGGRMSDRFVWDLENTDPGTYYIGIRIEDGANVVVIHSEHPVTVNNPPTLEWVNPPALGATVVQGSDFELRWEDQDDDAATLISLYLDVDDIDFNGNEIPLTGGNILLQDTEDKFTFNSGIINIPQGQSSVVITPVARLNDGVNAAVTVRSHGQITVHRNTPPRITVLEPRSETVLFDNIFTLVWNDDDPDSDAVIDFFLDTKAQGANGKPIDGATGISEDDETDRLTVDFSDVEPGRYWIYARIDDGWNRPYIDYAPAPINILAGTETVEFGVYMMDRFGQVYTVGDVNMRFANLPVSGTDEYRDVQLSADGMTLIRLRKDGTIEQYGRQKVVITAPAPVPFAPDNEYIDVEFTADEKGLILLDRFGNLVSLGEAPVLNGAPRFGFDLARDLELTPDGLGGFILDAYGGIHPVGNAIGFNEFPFFGYDIARALALDSKGGYVLDGAGAVYPIGRSADLSGGSDFGYDIARDLMVFENGGFYILDGQGSITSHGNATLISPSNQPAPDPYFPGLDVMQSFAKAGRVTTIDMALQALSTVRKFEVAFRNEDLESLVSTLSWSYEDEVYLSRDQLIYGGFDTYRNITGEGILHEWRATTDQFSNPLAGFDLTDISIEFSDDGQTAEVHCTAARVGYRSATAEIDLVVPHPPLGPEYYIEFSAAERDFVSWAMAFETPVNSRIWVDDVGDHRGVLLYIDRADYPEYGNTIDAGEWDEQARIQLKDISQEAYTMELTGYSWYRLVFATAVDSYVGYFPFDDRPVNVKYLAWSPLVDIDLTFTLRREGPTQWSIIEISPIQGLMPY